MAKLDAGYFESHKAFPLLRGLFMVGRHLVRYRDSDDAQDRKGGKNA